MQSMTGFGSAQRETKFGRMSVEVRSVNNRFLEVNPRLGSGFASLEMAVRAIAKERLSRGKVDVVLRFDPSEDFVPPARINRGLLRDLIEQLKTVDAGAESIRVEALLSIPGVVISESELPQREELDAAILSVVADAIENHVADRLREGGALRETLVRNHRALAEHCSAVTAAREDVVAKYRERLMQRLEDLMGPKASTLDPGRLEQEVTLFADKADISEECLRLDAHLKALDDALSKNGEAVGRSLDFLAQELLREINTIGSKCRDLEIGRRVLDMKQELESLREMVANVE